MIGANIKKLRMQHGMTQKNLADKLFVSAQAVSRWENNEVEPSISTILELAKIFDVTADEILGLEAKEDFKEEIDDAPKEEIQKTQAPPRQILALCEKCNSPIYNPSEIVRVGEMIYCSQCQKTKEEREHVDMLVKAKKRRIFSFIFGSLAGLIALAIVLSKWSAFSTPSEKFVGVFFAISMFTFVSCAILNNNFVGYMFLRICSWSIRAPGLIFTFDLDGFIWLIGMKLLFAILGVVIGIAMFFLALSLSSILSVFVYPYAIITNFKKPENTFI